MRSDARALVPGGGTFEQGSMPDLGQLYPPELLSQRWEEFGIRIYTSLEEMLRDESIEVISLCTPDHTHAELADKILRSGRHLLLEKPLALTLREAEGMLDEIVNALGLENTMIEAPKKN